MRAMPLYAISGRAASTFDPTTLNLSGYWRDYAGTSWTGVSSAGTSGGIVLADNLSGGNAPAVGASLNGRSSADFNGSSSFLGTADAAGQLLSNFVSATAGSFWALVELDTLAADPGAGNRFNVPAIWDDNAATFAQCTVHTGGATLFLDSESTFSPIATATKYLVQGVWNGSTNRIRLNSGSFASTAQSAIGSLASTLRIGRGSGGFLDGRIWEFAISGDVLTDTTFDNIKGYINTRYNLSL